MLRVQPQVEREERETESLVLLDVPELVPPEAIGRLECEDDDVPESDGRVMPTGEHEMREAAIAHIQETSIAEPRTREREPAENMSDRVGMVSDERARKGITARRRRPLSAPRRSGARA